MEVRQDQGKFKQVIDLLSYNGKNINGMTVQEVADVLNVLPNPCRLKLSRHAESCTSNRRDYASKTNEC